MKTDISPELVALNGPFTKIARAMSANWGIRIVPSGTKCSTDGHNVIHIPYTADYLPAEMRQVLHGHLDHEVCHVAEEKRHAENDKITPMTLIKSEKISTMRMLFNVFEDIRIETRYSEIYPGVGENLDAGNRRSAEEWQRKIEAGEDSNFWHTFGCAIILIARGQKADWARQDPEISEALDLCEEEIAESTGLSWGEDAMDLARRVYAKVKDHAEQQQKRPQDGQEAGPGDMGDGDGSADGGDEKAPQDDDGGISKSKGALGESDVDDLTDLARAKMEDYVVEDARIHQRYIPNPKALQLDAVVPCPVTDDAYYLKARGEVAQQIGGLRSRQRMVLQSWARRKVRVGLEDGFIDDDALPAARMGDRRVFSDMTQKKDLNTAIEVLIDCSGSMGSNDDEPKLYAEKYDGRNAAYYALRTTIALAEAWSALGVPNEFTGFYNHAGWNRYAFTEEDQDTFICRPPFEYQVFKSFEDKLSQVRGRFCSIIGRGSNVDGEAVLWAARRLATRPERRKILMVISDGMPATDGLKLTGGMFDFRPLQRHLYQSVCEVTSNGIEVIGIGAGTAGPAHFYNAQTGASFVMINNLSTMAVDIFRMMKGKLTGVAA